MNLPFSPGLSGFVLGPAGHRRVRASQALLALVVCLVFAVVQQAEVERVLEEIGAQGVPQILVYNKLDQIEPAARPRVLLDEIEQAPGLRVPRVFVSALTGEGLGALREAIAAQVAAAGLNSGAEPPTLPDGSPVPEADLIPLRH